MAWPYQELTFDLLGGYNNLDNAADILQVPRQPQIGTLDPSIPIRMALAEDVWAPNNRSDIATRPGNSDVRSTAFSIGGTNGIVTGMLDQAAIASAFLLAFSVAGQRHTLAQDSTNPPAELTGGTNPAIGQDNLATFLNFTDGTNRGTIVLWRLRDLPQFVNASQVRSNFTVAGTGLTSLKPGFGEIFGQRGVYFDYDQDGTIHKNRGAYTDLRDGNLITDITTQFESFERGDQDDQVRGAKRISDFLIVGGRDFVEFLGLTPAASKPFGRQEVPGGIGKGPMSHQGMINAQQRVVWPAVSGIYSLEGSRGEILKEWTVPIKPYWTSLEQTRLEFIVAGYDPSSDIGVWAVTPSGGTQHTRVVAVNFTKGECYIWLLTRNAFANRVVSGQQRLIGGGYAGKFRNEVRTDVFTGSADDASTAINADVQTPLHHCGLPGVKKLFVGVKVWFVNQSTSEAVTLNWRTDTNNAFAGFSASPYTVTSSDKPKFFPLSKAGTGLQIEFKDVNRGQAFRVSKYAIVFKLLEPALV